MFRAGHLPIEIYQLIETVRTFGIAVCAWRGQKQKVRRRRCAQMITVIGLQLVTQIVETRGNGIAAIVTRVFPK